MRAWTHNSVTQPPTPARHRRIAAVLAAVLAGLLLPALPAFSQTRAERRREILQAHRMRVRQALRRQAARRAGFFARLRELPPKEQERVLKNDKRFQSLPPARQQQIRENLKHWNQLSADQKEQVRKREEIYSQLTPEQRRNVREMSGEWRNLRPAERLRVRMALRRMRGMTPEERQKFLDSPQFRQRFSSEEQKIVRGLGQLFPDTDAPDR
jgi:type II secretory pathway pseudopilin PulG